jgi:dUTP pyrophosphatase
MVDEVLVRISRVGSVEMPLPKYQTEGAAGMDVHAATTETVTLEPLERRMFPTGLTVAIPPGFEIQVRPRSGLAAKRGVTVINTPGTIDSDYRGEIGVVLVNLSNEHAHIEPGERIAQLVVAKVERARFELVESLDETSRGAGGYGSTGTR